MSRATARRDDAVGGQEVRLLQDVEQVQSAPPTRDLVLQRAQLLGFRQSLELRDGDPRFAAAGDHTHAAGGVAHQRRLQPVERRDQPTPQPGDELAGGQGLAQRGVVDLPGGVEVAGQVVFGLRQRLAPATYTSRRRNASLRATRTHSS